MNKIEFYNLLKSAVMFSPSCAEKCQQLQTFRVIDTMSGGLVRSENLGATICEKDKPYFWSRLWHESKYSPNVAFDFPALVVIEQSYTVDQPIGKNNKRCYNFNISVLDKYVDSKGPKGCQGCAGRSVNEIYEDTEALLFQALGFLSEAIEVKFSDGTNLINHKELINYWRKANLILPYTDGRFYGQQMQESTKGATAYKSSIPAEGLFGNSINLNICIRGCDDTVYDFSLVKDFGVVSHEAGCKTCG